MATGDADPVFVDTNVLVYANVARAPLHAEALTALRAYHQVGAPLCTSRQVLWEYLAVLSRPQSFASLRPVAILIERVRYFESRFRVLEDSPQVTVHLLLLLEQLSIGGKQVHGANIVATMRVYGIDRLLTANVGDFARFAHLITLLALEALHEQPCYLPFSCWREPMTGVTQQALTERMRRELPHLTAED